MLTFAFAFNVSAQDEPPPAPAGQDTVTPVEALIAIPPLETAADFEARKEELAPRQPAPPLTDMWVLGVYSTNCGGGSWEVFPSPGTFATSCGHGGPTFRVAVIEVGYGSNPIARYQSGQLGSAYDVELWCEQFGGGLAPCSPGQTVVAFVRYYNLDGRSVPGQFQYQNTSTNSPWNTMSTSINILP
ncbi:hypothetical protein CAI21_17415 [Alkalilimnicola ehrlichii]|uniref:DUF4879 domain-containing protein n=1 Tax=Alkalilimnicola ehrlichii TaxID=351052 RepID=A0A3E0WM00_9GAMM|nr:DUF4879 domain-containing protein [Alkalilimnicola ehrlichii]RFA26258.1 hypothetical protein CAI21_17415 [Alkalilimnicola ehrlichii]RFA33243.1 hypothetical protein CAL65_17900 [Alkalilimnicola ehrlichii]